MLIYQFVIAGIASLFYPQDFSPALHVKTPYVCAMNVVPVGTEVVVDNVDNGLSSHCIITGTGPYADGRILDASPTVASELGYTGLAAVRVYRVVGRMPNCHLKPPDQSCKTPPTYCVLDLPKPALVSCK